MKRILALFSIAAICILLAGCGKQDGIPEVKKNPDAGVKVLPAEEPAEGAGQAE